MDQIIYSDTLLTTLYSCNCTVGYFFSKNNFNTVNQLIKTLSPELLLSYNNFDIGFLIWNSLSSSLSIVMQRLSSTDTLPFMPNLLSEIETLIIEEDCLQYSRFILEDKKNYKTILVNRNKELKLNYNLKQ